MGYCQKVILNLQKISLDILGYPFISQHILRYPKISKGANFPMTACKVLRLGDDHSPRGCPPSCCSPGGRLELCQCGQCGQSTSPTSRATRAVPRWRPSKPAVGPQLITARRVTGQSKFGVHVTWSGRRSERRAGRADWSFPCCARFYPYGTNMGWPSLARGPARLRSAPSPLRSTRGPPVLAPSCGRGRWRRSHRDYVAGWAP